tara:strand:- start:1523 stop:2596 length:1074 start_codon:yes stop_codon:yes gene_type:complete
MEQPHHKTSLVLQSSDLILQICSRVPYHHHSTLRCVNKRICELLLSPEFTKARRELGCVEMGIIFLKNISHLDESGYPYTNTECWLLAGTRWLQLPSPSVTHHCVCSAVHGDRLFVCGGCGGASKTVEVYSHSSCTWKFLRVPMNEFRNDAVCCVVDGSLVVSGGFSYDDERYLKTTEIYDPMSGKWTKISPLLDTGIPIVACELDNRLFVVTGHLTSPELDTVNTLQLWNKDSQKWTLCEPMPNRRFRAACVVYYDRIMIIGGYVWGDDGMCVDAAGSTSVILYDPKSDKWIDGSPLPEPCVYGHAVACDGAVILFGLSRILKFEDNAWEYINIPGIINAKRFGDELIGAHPITIG